MNADDLSPTELVEALMRWPSLDAHTQAARQLIVSHGTWLRRPEFRPAITLEVYCGLVYASIDWPAAVLIVDAATASESDMAVLRFACLLAGPPAGTTDPWSPWALRGILKDLDERNASLTNTTLAVTAFVTAATARRL